MTTLIERHGDLFTSDAPGLAHGCNTEGRMGAGIAAQFRARHPEMYRHYADLCRAGDLIPGEVFMWVPNDGPVIFNLASQDDPGPHARLEWVDRSVRYALYEADAKGIERIALPRVGCGIGGLDWADVKRVLKKATADFDCDLEVWSL